MDSGTIQGRGAVFGELEIVGAFMGFLCGPVEGGI